MDSTDKLKHAQHRKIQLQKNLPSLRSSTLISKTIIALSKVDIDSRNINRERAVRASLFLEKEHTRSQSGLTMRKTKEAVNEGKTLTRMQFQGMPASQFKLGLRDIKEEEATNLTQVVIDKAKVSSKSYGIVRAYSANSHPGPLLSFNQDRICIVTNLTKTNIRQKQVSFFGVYDGNDGAARADYMRDNFHLTLSEDTAFPNDMDSALRHSLQKIGSSFADDPRFSGDESTVGFVILITYNEEVHYLQGGSCKAVFSSHFGNSLFFPSKNETVLLTREPSKKSKSVADLIKQRKGTWRESVEVEYRRFGSGDALDFVALGSEGVFENLKIREVGKKLWLSILKNKEESIHFAVGEANNSLLEDVFAAQASKNSSLIIVAFEPVFSCLEGAETREALTLPYLSKE